MTETIQESGAERRGTLRISCNVGVVCQNHAGAFQGRLKDVSRTGLRLELPERLSRGDSLHIARPGVQLEAVRAVVRWCRRHSRRDIFLVGLEVDMPLSDLSSSWIHPILSTFDFLHPLDVDLAIPHQPLPEPIVEEPAPPPVAEPKAAPEAAPEKVEAREEAPQEVVAPIADRTGWNDFLHQAQRQLQGAPLLKKIIRGFRDFAFEDAPSVEERRRIQRLTCHYPLTLSSSGSPLPVTVMDLSAAGAALISSRRLAKGSVVMLGQPQLPNMERTQSLQATVRYCRGLRERFRVGVEFRGNLVDSWVGEALFELGFDASHMEQKRRYVRAQTQLPIEIRTWDGEFLVGTLLDLSRGGALLNTNKAWGVGEALRLILGPVGFLPVLFLSAVVLHQRPDQDGWLLNVSFIDASGTNQSRLDQYIKTILAQRFAEPEQA